MKRRVVVTGMGVVSPIGNDIPTFGKNLSNGISGRGNIQSFDATGFPVQHACEVKNFDPRRYRTQVMDPFIQYAVAATHEALERSGVDLAAIDPYRVGISVSSSKGGVHTIDRFKDRFYRNPSAILGARIYCNSVPNFAAQWIARRWKLRGPAKCYVAACATGTVSICEGARMVAESDVDYCVAGASDASVVPLMLAGYRKMKALAPEYMRPFDKRRNGFLVGEGAGIVFLETLESAKARGAKIYAEVHGFAYGTHSKDAILFREDDPALEATIYKALSSSELSAQDMNYVNLHGTGTPLGDIYETQQLRLAFGKSADHIPMSSTKSMLGHMLGASGSVEMIASILAMEEGFVPPTIGLEKPDPKCDLDYVPNHARKAQIKTAMSLSMGFGGHVAVMIFGKEKG